MGSRRQRLIGALMVIALTGLPVLTTVCEAFCDRSVASPAHATTDPASHDGMTGCHESSPAANQRVTSASTHECGTHDETVREAEAVATTARVLAGTLAIANVSSLSLPALASSVQSARDGYVFPPGSIASHVSLVLRI